MSRLMSCIISSRQEREVQQSRSRRECPLSSRPGVMQSPGTSGRLDPKANQVIVHSSTPLKSWAIGLIPGRRGGKPDQAGIDKFFSNLAGNRNSPLVLI